MSLPSNISDITAQKVILSLTHLKDRGGLLYPSADVIKIIRACKIALKCFMIGNDFKNPKILNKSSRIKVKMRNNVIHVISGDVFNSLEEHDLILTMAYYGLLL